MAQPQLTPRATQAPRDALVAVLERRSYSVAMARGLIRSNLIQAVGSVLSVCMMGVLAVYFVKGDHLRYAAVDTDGTVAAAHVLSKPFVAETRVLTFAQEAFMRAWRFDYVNYRTQLEDIRDWFTPRGFEGFLGALKANGVEDGFRNHEMVASASITGAPVIVRHGVVNGVYTWVVEMEGLVHLQGRTQFAPLRGVVTMTILRREPLRSTGKASERAIVIDSIQMRQK